MSRENGMIFDSGLFDLGQIRSQNFQPLISDLLTADFYEKMSIYSKNQLVLLGEDEL